MKLTHIGISNFRSIGETPVMIDLEKKVTVFVGQNDGGKSNVLLGLERVSKTRKIERQDVTEIDCHLRIRNGRPLVHLRMQGEAGDQRHFLDLGSVITTGDLGLGMDEGTRSSDIESLDDQRFATLARGWNSAISVASLHGPERERVARRISQDLVENVRSKIPVFHKIPEFRRIESAGAYSVEGKGIVTLLASWQHPEIGQEHLRKKFDQIETLLRTLLSRPDAEIEVPPKQDKIIVNDAPMRLPLESHGTGVHQLIILAIAVLSQDNVIFGIEEPEIHLHPLLQKRFLQFLLHETTNRYVISTHSPALIAPSAEVDVIHLKMVDGVTIPMRVETDAGSLAVLEDLGIQPSDLLQANSVIWVEGPSDRTYIKRWIEILHPDLVEGIDYSIMFYGGRLLAHLSMAREDSVEQEEMKDFIKLLRINQRSALVMDSDRDSSKADINDTKKRLIAECEKNGVHCWVTDGREIENYLADEWVAAALKEHALLDGEVSVKPFMRFETSMANAAVAPGGKYASAKATWAHRIAKHIKGDEISVELEKHIDEMIRAICPGRRRSREDDEADADE